MGGVGGGIDGWTDEQAQTNLPLLHKESKLKKRKIFFFGGVVGRVVGRGGWMVRRAGPNQFAPSTFSKLVA